MGERETREEVELSFGVSDHVRRAPGMRVEGHERIITIPVTGDIQDITGCYDIEKYRGLALKPSKGDGCVTVEEGFPVDGSAVLLYWIPQRGEWIAVTRRNVLEDHGEDDEYGGPYRIDDFCAEKILDAYDMADCPSLHAQQVCVTSPEELDKHVLDTGRFSSDLTEHIHAENHERLRTKAMDDTGFMSDIAERFDKKDYRPELVLVVRKNGLLLFVKSARSSVWNLPQEGVDPGEKIRDAFLRGWLEEICHINIKSLERNLPGAPA